MHNLANGDVLENQNGESNKTKAEDNDGLIKKTLDLFFLLNNDTISSIKKNKL